MDWFWIILTLALAVAVVVMSVMLLRMSVALGQLRGLAQRLARGGLAEHVRVEGPLRARDLADSLGAMARQLDHRLSTVVQQRNELGAVLWSMVEGVVAIDTHEQVISLNRAAAEMLSLDPDRAIGRSIQELVRNTALQKFIARTVREKAPIQDEMTLRGEDPAVDRCIEAQSALLRDAGGEHIGVLLVLHDVTRLRRLEAIRRDFVANVSHEIKTPVSAIKAAVETVQDEMADMGDMGEGRGNREAAVRFLAIIARQADRLGAIVEDLLSLARIEQEAGLVRAELQGRLLRPVIDAAVETCQPRAKDKGIVVEVGCDPRLNARINEALLEQALVNLIDNALKYSPDDTAVRINAQRVGREVVLAVHDRGRGIEPKHLSRVFERFYRTDRARSRELGGTGLGLSIVKHVAEAHGGRASVDSTPGRGSVFRLHLLTSEIPASLANVEG